MTTAYNQDVLIEISNLRAGYGQRVILKDVSLSLKKGEILALIGGSGCGKSTVLRAVAGLLPPMSGQVRVFGQDPYELDDEQRMHLLRQMGMLFQNGALLGSLTVGENVALPYREHANLPEPVLQRIVQDKLALVGLPNVADMMPAELSGGMRKRASLSRAMVLDPRLLLCDEPSAGLDPVVAAGIDEALLDLKRRLGTTMLVVTHDLASIEKIADRVVMLQDGLVLAQGPLATVKKLEDPRVKKFFARQHEEDSMIEGKSLLQILEGSS